MNGPTHPLIEFSTETNQRIAICCRAAAEREERSEDEQACEVLVPFWEGPGTAPDVANLPAPEAAQLLIRAGSLTTRLGSKLQIVGWQELSKDFLSRAADLADSAGDVGLWVEARKYLGLCYWREGAFDEARLMFVDTLNRSGEGAGRFAVMMDLAMVERSSGQIQRALEIYRVARNFAASQSDFLKATYHNGLALALKAAGRLDDALIEMTAAGYHFEQAGHQRYLMATQVNLGNLLVAAKNYSEAHRHLERGAELAQQLRDDLHLAQALDSLALAHLAQGNPQAAESVARKSVEILERGEQYALLIDSMVTLGRVLARLRDDGALRVYVRAYEMAADKIGSVRAGSIATELISELAGDACLRTGTTLDDAVNAFEASVINAALDATGGKQLEAAMRLGLKHQTLSFILNTRHKNLHPNPDRKQRQRSIIKRK